MQDADDVVDVVLVDGQAGVLAVADDYLDLGNVVREIDADDLVVRHHDVVDGHFLQVEDAEQHLLVAAGNTAAGLVHDGAQLFSRQRLQSGIATAHAEQEQHAVRRDIGEPDDRVQ